MALSFIRNRCVFLQNTIMQYYKMRFTNDDQSRILETVSCISNVEIKLQHMYNNLIDDDVDNFKFDFTFYLKLETVAIQRLLKCKGDYNGHVTRSILINILHTKLCSPGLMSVAGTIEFYTMPAVKT